MSWGWVGSGGWLVEAEGSQPRVPEVAGHQQTQSLTKPRPPAFFPVHTDLKASSAVVVQCIWERTTRSFFQSFFSNRYKGLEKNKIKNRTQHFPAWKTLEAVCDYEALLIQTFSLERSTKVSLTQG